ncbi:hypothetical protein D0814_23260 [Vibrio parahaemolyticus]|nr:hypothetical protein [Vibrio parahaemolyticus]
MFHCCQPYRTGRRRDHELAFARLPQPCKGCYQFFNQTSGLLSVESVETILDVVPLAGYSASDALEWTTEIALRRYELALAQLGVKRG